MSHSMAVFVNLGNTIIREYFVSYIVPIHSQQMKQKSSADLPKSSLCENRLFSPISHGNNKGFAEFGIKDVERSSIAAFFEIARPSVEFSNSPTTVFNSPRTRDLAYPTVSYSAFCIQ